MKARYKILIVIGCVFAGWILFPNIPGAVCHFAYSEEAINNKGTHRPEFCSITGINFFGYPLHTNFFREDARPGIFGDCYYENNGEIQAC